MVPMLSPIHKIPHIQKLGRVSKPQIIAGLRTKIPRHYNNLSMQELFLSLSSVSTLAGQHPTSSLHFLIRNANVESIIRKVVPSSNTKLEFLILDAHISCL